MASVLQAKGGTATNISQTITLDAPVTAGNEILVAAWAASFVGTRGKDITYSDNQGNTAYNWTFWLGEGIEAALIGLFTVTASASGTFSATCTVTSGHFCRQMIVAELPPGYKIERGLKPYWAPRISPPVTAGYFGGNFLTAPQSADTIILAVSAMLNSGNSNSRSGDTLVETISTDSLFQLWQRYENTAAGNSLSFFEAGPYPNVLEAFGAAFSKPLTRPGGMTAQYFSNSMHGDFNAPLGPDWYTSGGLWSTRAYGSFSYLPLVGDSIVLGICLPNASGFGGHIPTYNVQDNAGNVYTYRGISTAGGVNGCQIVFYTAPVTAVPAAGLLRVQVDRTDNAVVQNAQALSLCGACYSFGLNLDAAQIRQVESQTVANPSLLTTFPVTVNGSHLLVLAGSVNGGLGITNAVFNAEAGFTKRAEFRGNNPAWLPSEGCLGVNAIFDKTVTTGTHTGQASITQGQNNILLLAIPIAPLTVACPVLNSIPVNTSYSSFIQVSGGVPPYTYEIISGSLPPGLTLNGSTGEISGVTTSAAGAYSWTVRITDSTGTTTDITCGISVTGCPNLAEPTTVDVSYTPISCTEPTEV